MNKLAALLFLALAFPAWGLERVALQLKWKHQFQFAGYYAAIEKGFYREAGLEVELREAGPDTHVIDEVTGGRAQFGVGTSDLLLARADGRPVVALAVILQHSALVLLARQDAVPVVQSLAGKRVMVAPGESELYAYLRQEGVKDDAYRRLPLVFDPSVLIAGKVDAMSGYSTDEPFLLRRAGMAFSLFTPRSSGIDFYGDNLFTSEALLKAKPALVAAFRTASLRGWHYAMENPEEIADLILARYSRRHDKAHLLFEAGEMSRLMQPELVEIGQMNPGRWRHMADVYAEVGMLPEGFSIDGLIYDPRPPKLPAWAPPGIFLGIVAMVLIAAVAWRFAYFNRALNAEVLARKEAEQVARAHAAETSEINARLRQQLDEVAKLQTALKEQAIRDGLTGLYNRRYLDETLERELARARRDNLPLCMVLLDIDHFKRLNDTYGHQTGDEALRLLARKLLHHVRAEDIACRYGGEEFLILMPHIPLAVAADRAEGWRRVIEEIRLPGLEGEIGFTASLGVAAYPEHGRTPDELTHGADLALYAAKRRGRNQVVVYGPELEAGPSPSRRSRDT
ncbi:MAG TPA: diguanylate cyclase [Rhodocyclaceae bacterium]|nr:diguanylate cyclase [Rhodocyclaceae bacterium]